MSDRAEQVGRRRECNLFLNTGVEKTKVRKWRECVCLHSYPASVAGAGAHSVCFNPAFILIRQSRGPPAFQMEFIQTYRVRSRDICVFE